METNSTQIRSLEKKDKSLRRIRKDRKNLKLENDQEISRISGSIDLAVTCWKITP